MSSLYHIFHLPNSRNRTFRFAVLRAPGRAVRPRVNIASGGGVLLFQLCRERADARIGHTSYRVSGQPDE